MWAALRLRLIEAQRRGGPVLLGIAFVAVLAIALFGGETVDGRYGLATDVAATLGYVAAVFVGAFPLAIDRERKRSYLPSASPVSPWQWALGNSAAAAVVAATFTLTLYVAAGIGAAAGGGVETWAVTHVGSEGMFRLRPTPQRIHVPAETKALRLTARTFLVADESVGTADTAVIGLSGRGHEVHDDRPITLPVDVQQSGDDHIVMIRNRSPEYAVGIDIGSLRALTGRRSFFPNSLGAAIAPALGAGALAALGAAAGANLGPPIAALALTLILLLGALKGFLLDVIEFEGTLKQTQSTVVQHAGHTHGGGDEFRDHPLRAEVKRALSGLLHAVPTIGDLDRTGAVATGEWVEGRRIDSATYLLLCSLAIGAVVGGIGIYSRRTP